MKDQDYKRQFLMSGRQCGWSEDAVAYICVDEDEDPEPVFISEILYGGILPEGWQDRFPTYEENSFGEWASINGCIELPFGVRGSETMPQALDLSDFRFEDGKISARATPLETHPGMIQT